MDTQRLARFAAFFRTGFLGWLESNQHLYAVFEQQALEAVRQGRTHFSARTIVHELRDLMGLGERAGDGYRINDHHSPDLARVFAILHPAHAMLWEYRRADSEAFLAALRGDFPVSRQLDLFTPASSTREHPTR